MAKLIHFPLSGNTQKTPGQNELTLNDAQPRRDVINIVDRSSESIRRVTIMPATQIAMNQTFQQENQTYNQQDNDSVQEAA